MCIYIYIHFFILRVILVFLFLSLKHISKKKNISLTLSQKPNSSKSAFCDKAFLPMK